MPKDIVFVATSDISSNTETEFTKKPVRQIISAIHIKTGATHTHKAFTIVGSATGGDISSFVPMKDGAGNDVAGGNNIIGKGGLTADEDVNTGAGGAVSVQSLTVVSDTPDASHEIQLSSETAFKCYDDISAGDILVLKVIEKGEYSGA